MKGIQFAHYRGGNQSQEMDDGEVAQPVLGDSEGNLR
jgi:hypothetical protein